MSATTGTDSGKTAAKQHSVAIRPANGNSDMVVVRELFLEYAAGLGFSLCFQDFEAELAGLPGDYAPPAGGLWLAEVDGALAGCVALRPLEPGICEIKRLYLRPACRGLGLGRRMAETVLAAARSRDYDVMRLDTIDDMVAAQSLYRQLGFRERPPYGCHQHPRLRYFELAFDGPSR